MATNTEVEEETIDPPLYVDAVMMDHSYSLFHQDCLKHFRLTEENDSANGDRSFEKQNYQTESLCEQQVEGINLDNEKSPNFYNKELQNQVNNNLDKYDSVLLHNTELKKVEIDSKFSKNEEKPIENKYECEDFLETPVVQTRRQKQKLDEIITEHSSPKTSKILEHSEKIQTFGTVSHSPGKNENDITKKQTNNLPEKPITPRKRGRPRKNTGGNQKDTEKSNLEEEKNAVLESSPQDTPLPRKRGRPRKYPLQPATNQQTAIKVVSPPNQRKRGRPRKTPTSENKGNQEQESELKNESDDKTELETSLSKEMLLIKEESETSSQNKDQYDITFSSKQTCDRSTSETKVSEENTTVLMVRDQELNKKYSLENVHINTKTNETKYSEEHNNKSPSGVKHLNKKTSEIKHSENSVNEGTTTVLTVKQYNNSACESKQLQESDNEESVTKIALMQQEHCKKYHSVGKLRSRSLSETKQLEESGFQADIIKLTLEHEEGTKKPPSRAKQRSRSISGNKHSEESGNEFDVIKMTPIHKEQTLISELKSKKEVDKTKKKEKSKILDNVDKDGMKNEKIKTDKLRHYSAESEGGQVKIKTKRIHVRRESRTPSIEALSIEPSLFSTPDVMIKKKSGSNSEQQPEHEEQTSNTPKVEKHKISLLTRLDSSEKDYQKSSIDNSNKNDVLKTIDNSVKDTSVIEERVEDNKNEFVNLNEKVLESAENLIPVENISTDESKTAEVDKKQRFTPNQKKPVDNKSKDNKKFDKDSDNVQKRNRTKKTNGLQTPKKGKTSKEDKKEKKDDNIDIDYTDNSSDADWLPEDDPERLWCICRKPHGGRFMIGCDGCEEWFHGSCVGITRQKGRKMEKDRKEWLCSKCKKEREVGGKQNIWKEVKEEKKEEVADIKREVSDLKKDVSKEVKKEIKDVKKEVKEEKKDELNVIKKEDTKDEKKELKSPVLVHSSQSFAHKLPIKKPDLKKKPEMRAETKCLECKKPVTIPGIFCSTECLEKHVKESLEAIKLERERKKEPPIKPSEHRIQVLEHNSGKLLTGAHAPLAEHLLEWIKINPSFQILKPRHIPTTKDCVVKKGDGKTEKKKVEEESAGPEPVRLNVRKTLRDTLNARLKDAENLHVLPDEIKKIAVKIEEELFRYFKDTGAKYKAKYRSLVFNIKDQRNEGLFRKILKSSISPEKLVRMSPGEMASKELMKWREQENKHTLEMIKREQLDQLEQANHPHHTKKTHKGEIEIEEESLATLDQQFHEKALERESVSTTLGNPLVVSSLRTSGDPTSPGTPVDTTDQHRSHLFDLNCKICTGKVAPPPKEPSIKKVRVAHTIAVEEKETSSSTKTDLDIRISEIFKQVDSKESEKEFNKHSENIQIVDPKQKKDVFDEKPDQEPSSTVSLSSPDSGSTTLSGSSQTKPSRSLPSVWKGFISMQDVAKFVTSAYKVSGPTDFLTQDIPDTVQVCGRITQEQMWEYVSRTKQSGNKELIVIQFQPANDEEKVAYGAFYSYLNSRKRYGVVGNASKMIKDFYILPLPSYSPVPTVLMPFDGPGLSATRSHLLLGVIVRHRNRPQTFTQLTESHFQSENMDPYEPSYTPPLDTLPYEKDQKLCDDNLTPLYTPTHTTANKRLSVTDDSEPYDPSFTPPLEKMPRKDTCELEDVTMSDSGQNLTPAVSSDEDKPYDPEETDYSFPQIWKQQTSMASCSPAVIAQADQQKLLIELTDKAQAEKKQTDQQYFQGISCKSTDGNKSSTSTYQNYSWPDGKSMNIKDSAHNLQHLVQNFSNNVCSEQSPKKESLTVTSDVLKKLSSGLPPHLRNIINAINKVTQQVTSGTRSSQNTDQSGEDTEKMSLLSEDSIIQNFSNVSQEEPKQETWAQLGEKKLPKNVSNIISVTKLQDPRLRGRTIDEDTMAHHSPHAFTAVSENVRPSQVISQVIPPNKNSLICSQSHTFSSNISGRGEKKSLSLSPRKSLSEPPPPGVDFEELDNSATASSFPLVSHAIGSTGMILGPKPPPIPPPGEAVKPPLPPSNSTGYAFSKHLHSENPYVSPSICQKPIEPHLCTPHQHPGSSYNSYQYPYSGGGATSSTKIQTPFGQHSPTERSKSSPFNSNKDQDERERSNRYHEHKRDRDYRREHDHSRERDRDWRSKDKKKHYHREDRYRGDRRRKHHRN
ncbi:PHD finger protein 3-like isoform X2 [Limulus polyphemus]|uniref:PHD finger protein 3-like isoform X2 n=1 Tax=Limulus polyphemus TaxID=6850 RepID=A0ABM1T2A3_LIMPO|nr:PHD finger protein 3-like isoform X2 [Limulus polyphemus]